jgi:hypothetical protein
MNLPHLPSKNYDRHREGALQRGAIFATMTGDSSIFRPLLKENTSNLYIAMKNSISPVTFVAETGDHLTVSNSRTKARPKIHVNHYNIPPTIFTLTNVEIPKRRSLHVLQEARGCSKVRTTTAQFLPILLIEIPPGLVTIRGVKH